jgi:xanthine dehydrogenase YagR molybdenum-binding subunit
MFNAEILQVGRPVSRVDGRLKVTGQAKYAAEYSAPGLLHGYIVNSTVAVGRIVAIDTEAARAMPGVVEIFTHENCGKAAWLDRSWRDEVAPPGHPFRPLHSERILFDGQPIAMVVADSFETARDAASLVRFDYDVAPHSTELEKERSQAYVPPKKRSGIPPPPIPRGDAEEAFAKAPVKISRDYRVNAEHHNPMEMFGSTLDR